MNNKNLGWKIVVCFTILALCLSLLVSPASAGEEIVKIQTPILNSPSVGPSTQVVTLPSRKGISTDKEWTIRFSYAIDLVSVNSNAIYVVDSLGNRVDTSLTPQGDKVVVKPLGSYRHGETYTLYIKEEVSSSTGRLLNKVVKMDFTIRKEIVKTPLTSGQVDVSDQDQTVSYGDNIRITIPGGLLEKAETITISSLDQYPDLPDYMGELQNIYDVSVGERSTFLQPVSVEIPYDLGQIPEGWHPQEALIGLHWDETNQLWHQVPLEVDTDRQKAIIHTQQLSPVATAVQKDLGYVESDRFRVVFNNNLNTYCNCWQDQEAMARYVLAVLDESYKKYVVDMGFEKPGFLTSSWLAGGRVMVMLGNFLESSYSPKSGYLYISNIHVPPSGETDLKHEVAHEFFHAIQNQYYSIFGMAARRWWIEATADYAAAGIMQTSKFAALDKRHFEKPLYHDPDVGDMHKYEVAHFIDFMVRHKGVQFKPLWDYLADSILVYDNLKTYLGTTMSSNYRDFARYVFFSADSPSSSKSPEEMGSTSELKLDDKELSHSFLLSQDCTAKLWGIHTETDITRGQRTVEVTMDRDSGSDLFVEVFLLKGNRRVAGQLQPLYTLSKSGELVYINVEQGDRLYVMATNTGTSQEAVNVTVKDATVELTIDPPEILDGDEDKEYTFSFEATNIPEPITEVSFLWDAGDGEEDSQGNERVTVQEGRAGDVQIKHSYLINKDEDVDEKEYTLTVRLVNTDTMVELAQSEAMVIVKKVKATVSILPPRIVTYELTGGATEATHDFEAVAQPQGNYRYDWDFGDGQSHSEIAEKSSPSHTYTGEGTYSPKVTIYDLDGKFLGDDTISITLEKAAGSGAGCGLPANYHTPPTEYREEWNGKTYVEIYGTEICGSFQYKYGHYEKYIDNVLRERGCYADCEKKYGFWEYWNDKGMKYREEQFALGGISHGIYRNWYDNGVRKIEENYDMGKKHGSSREWYDNGNKHVEANYKQDKVHGNYLSYYKTGDKMEEAYYDEGKLHGVYKRWNWDGNLSEVGNYYMGERIGQYTYYYAGRLDRIKDYDKRVTTYYNEEGEVEKTENW